MIYVDSDLLDCLSLADITEMVAVFELEKIVADMTERKGLKIVIKKDGLDFKITKVEEEPTPPEKNIDTVKNY